MSTKRAITTHIVQVAIYHNMDYDEQQGAWGGGVMVMETYGILASLKIYVSFVVQP